MNFEILFITNFKIQSVNLLSAFWSYSRSCNQDPTVPRSFSFQWCSSDWWVGAECIVFAQSRDLKLA
jgi:hypothetical protein